MSDETIIVEKQGTIFLAGPPLVKAATGETVSAEDLGGGDLHTRVSGVADALARDDAHALALARRAVGNLNRPPKRAIEAWKPVEPLYPADELMRIAPLDQRKQVGVRRLQAALRDHARHRICKAFGHADWHCRQQRRALFRQRAEGRAFH
jgi:3-methylcrotonyl-CoA carboxylase beta subunit